MRSFLCAVLCAVVVCATACSGKGDANAPASARFLPASADIAFRVDMSRVRAWPSYSELAPVALTSVEMLLAAAKDRCGLDVMGTATTIVAAKKGPLMSGDLTLIVSGLPKDKVATCLGTVAAADSLLGVTVAGDLFHAAISGRAIASGALLANGDVLVVSRNGAGIEPAAWKAEVTHGGGAAPTWWSALQPYTTEPVAVRAADDVRIVFATATLTDGLAIKAKVVNTTADGGKRDKTMINAMLSYLVNAKAGDGKVDGQGETTNVELTAKGEALASLIKVGGPALFSRGVDLIGKAAAGPVRCDLLTDAVGTYMQQTLASTSEDRKGEMAQVVARILPELQKTYVAQCDATKWAVDAISCHVDNANNLPRFEKCRLLLTDVQRTPFDAAVGAVLSKEMPAAPAGGSGSALGSGSAK